jgi:hypothetical protein
MDARESAGGKGGVSMARPSGPVAIVIAIAVTIFAAGVTCRPSAW